MIHFVNVEKGYQSAHGWRHVLRPVSLSLPVHRRIGVLGYNGSGKSTFLRLVSGVEEPDRGHVVRDCKVSWPLGFSGGLHQEMTGIDNAAFIAGIYDHDRDEVIRFVVEFTELGDYLDMPVRTYSSGMKARINFAISMALDFDVYLVDEITGVGDATFQHKAREMFRERAKNAGLLFVSHSEKSVRDYCDVALVIHDGYIFAFNSLKPALKFYADLRNRS